MNNTARSEPPPAAPEGPAKSPIVKHLEGDIRILINDRAIDSAEAKILEAEQQGKLDVAIRGLLRLAMTISDRPFKRAEIFDRCATHHQSLARRAIGHFRHGHYMNAAKLYQDAERVLSVRSEELKSRYRLRRIVSICLALVANKCIHHSEFRSLQEEIAACQKEAKQRNLTEIVERCKKIAHHVEWVLKAHEQYNDIWNDDHVQMIRFTECKLLEACGCAWEARQLFDEEVQAPPKLLKTDGAHLGFEITPPHPRRSR